MGIRKVHVVFKTHLDIGFTDMAASIIANYLEHFIPAALDTAERANVPGEPKLFVWTVGAYLIDLALRTGTPQQVGRLDRAIRRGDIAYHALPYTTHTELCGPELFDAGLGIAARLDEHFGRRTFAAKMTDVPGHTVAMIAPLVRRGVEYLHIGINAVARMPQVPPLFLWEDAAGNQLMVHYERSYGGATQLEGHDEALYFLHSQDNAGPPATEELERAFADIRSRYPGAQVVASTLDAFAEGLRSVRPNLPVVRGEIGDTWIHGTGSDPQKVSALRTLEALSRSWDQDGTWARHARPLPDGRLPRAAFLEQLLLVCEHTWGLDTKKFLTDFRNWRRADFDHARSRPAIPDADGDMPGYGELFQFARREFELLKPRGIAWEERSYALFERSHQEQRDYLSQAVALLPEALREQGASAIAPRSTLPLRAHAEVREHVLLNGWDIRLEGKHMLLRSPQGADLRVQMPIYQEVGLAAYERLLHGYLYQVQDEWAWAYPDNGKAGAEHSDAPAEDMRHEAIRVKAGLEDGVLVLEGVYPKSPQLTAGCPAGFVMRLEAVESGLSLTVRLHGKPANRKPEALFLPFASQAGCRLHVRKLGQWIDPAHTLSGGNQRTHGMDAFRYLPAQGVGLEIRALDAPLLCIGSPDLLDFDCSDGYERSYINLYNNLWGTNFRMWYEEDIQCRFTVRECAG